MFKKLLLLPIFLQFVSLYAQTVKTDVLVVGTGPGGIAAAIQSARSNVKTVLITENDQFLANTLLSGQIKSNIRIHSGFWGEFRDSLVKYYRNIKSTDTSNYGTVPLDTVVAKAIVKQITDSAKNLTTYFNTSFSAVKKNGDRWEITLLNNKKISRISARVVIDATHNSKLLTMLNLKIKNPVDFSESGDTFLYRTSIAAGIDFRGNKSTEWNVPLRSVIVDGADNLFSTTLPLEGNKNLQLLPFQLEVGQGVGALAAYCAFYKTTTKRMRIRVIQGELLNFKAYLLPFTDVSPDDPNWRTMQQIAATGLLKGVAAGDQFLFKPDSLVNTVEVKPVLMEIYTRAFLWFSKQNPGEKFTLGKLLSFISDYTLTDPDLLNSTIQKAWKTQFNFTRPFDTNRPVTRLEFAVLANKYLNPFARTVDLDGKLVN